MNLNEAKQAAYGSANRARHRIGTMMQVEPPATVADAAELVQMAEQLTCAAREIEARLKNIPEMKPGN